MGLQGRLDGRKITAGFPSPSNYTPTAVGNENVNKTSAHLKGIDNALAAAGGGGLSWSRITASQGATKDNGYLISASAAVTLTLPASPSEGDTVGVVDADGKATTYTLTVARNGSNIMGLAQDLTIDTDNSGFTLVYDDSTQGWVIVTEITGAASPMQWVKSTASETAEAGKGYLAVPTANYTLTLPASPAEGDRVGFRDAAGLASTYTLTIGRNGSNIEGSASDLTVDGDNSGFTLVYVDSTIGWVVVTEINNASIYTPQLLHIEDQKTSGTGGGTFTSGAWQTRNLNTVVTNAISGASLSSNQIILPAGKYYIEASAPAYQVNMHKTKLYNVTDTADIILGTQLYSPSSEGNEDRSFLCGEFTITAQKTIELQHRCQTTRVTYGYGNAWGAGFTELYSVVKIWKIYTG